MMILSATLIAALAANAPAQDRATTRPPQTDQTVTVPRDARLIVENFAGEVVIRAWDGDTLRVQARHASRARINIRTVPSGIRISSSAERGPAGSIDYEITAPRLDADQDRRPVQLRHHRRHASGGRGGDRARRRHRQGWQRCHGEVDRGRRDGRRREGRITASSVNESVTVTGSSGEIWAETVNGPITLQRIDSGNVEAGTINGDITYDGTAASAGRYRLTTHNGSIIVGVPETASATFSVRTYNGSFNSNLPVKGDGNVRSGRRVVYTLGNGNAEFELESFSGSIRLRKPGTMPTPKSKED